MQEIGYDPWNATQIVTQLEGDGIEMVQMRQGFSDMNSPMQELERLVTTKEISSDRNPVLRWMASNVCALEGPNETIRPGKANKKLLIDGIVALIMAIGRAQADDGEDDDSIYKTSKPMIVKR